MRTRRAEQFLMIDFEFIDMNIEGVLSPTLFSVYRILRRYVWRSDEIGSPRMQLLYKQGVLATKLKQPDVGSKLNLGRTQSQKYFRELKALGWIKVIPQNKNYVGAAIYSLGERVRASDGSWTEVFYADSFMADLWEFMSTSVKDLIGENARVNDLSDTQKFELITQFIQLRAARKSEPRGSEKWAGAARKSEPGRLGKVCSSNREVENRENSNNLLASLAPDSDTSNLPLEGLKEVPRVSHISTQIGLALDGQGVEADPELGFARATALLADFANIEEGEEMDEERLAKLREAVQAGRRKANEQLVINAEKKAAKVERSTVAGKPPKDKKADLWPLATAWSEEFSKAYPDVAQGKWSGKEWKQCQTLVTKHGAENAKLAIRYFIASFQAINKRIMRGEAMFPSLGLLLALDATLVPEAQRWHKYRDLKIEVDTWRAANPDEWMLPDDLRARYEGVKKDMEKLGL